MQHASLPAYMSVLVVVCSVIIGVTLGVTRDGLVPLLCALVFHQFVEGMGLAAMLIEVLPYTAHFLLFL